MSEEQSNQEEMTDEQAILKIAQAMKDNAPTPDEKQNVHTFLINVIKEEEPLNVSKVGNLRDDKEVNEIGLPTWNVRGAFEMARISDRIMGNTFFKEFFEAQAVETLATSLSREAFLVRQASVQTKQIADVTKRRKINKGMFKSTTEESGGDVTGAGGGSI